MGEFQYQANGECFVYTLNLFYVDGTVETIHIFTRPDKLNIMKVKFGRYGEIMGETLMTKEEGRQMWEELVRNGWKPSLDESGKPLVFTSSHSYFKGYQAFDDFDYSPSANYATNYALIA
jgi:hypothetical protein